MNKSWCVWVSKGMRLCVALVWFGKPKKQMIPAAICMYLMPQNFHLQENLALSLTSLLQASSALVA